MQKFHPTRISILYLLVIVVVMLPTLASANWVGGIRFNHPTPSYLPHAVSVAVTIDCKVSPPEGALISVMPFTNGVQTVGTATTGSIHVPQGESTVTRTFRVIGGDQVVDHVRVRMSSSDDTTVLLEFFVRVQYTYGSYGLFNVQIDKTDYSTLADGENLNIDVDYGSDGPGDVRIFARPYMDGSLVLGYGATGGVLGPPSGSAHQHFQFPVNDADMNQIHFKMTTPDQSQVLLEFNQPAHYFWRDVGISNLTYSHPSPASVPNSEFVVVTFDYNNPTGSPFHVWTAPMNVGGPMNGVFNEGSLPISSATGTASRYFGSTGDTDITHFSLLVQNQDQTVTYMNHQIPAEYHIGPHAIYNISMTPASPALIGYGEIVTVNFDYSHSYPGNVYIFGKPIFHGDWIGPLTHTSSPEYPPGSGSGSWGFTMAPSLEIDHVNPWIINTALTDTIFEYPVEAALLWGDSGWVTNVGGLGRAGLVLLGQNYPNPFNPITYIPVELSATSRVRLAIYDLRGHLVQSLADEVMAAGRHEIPFDGSELASGQYFYRLEGAGPNQTRTMTLVK